MEPLPLKKNAINLHHWQLYIWTRMLNVKPKVK